MFKMWCEIFSESGAGVWYHSDINLLWSEYMLETKFFRCASIPWFEVVSEWVSESVSQSVSDKHCQTVKTSFELTFSHARVTSIKFTKREWVSQWVSEWQALPMIGLGSDKNKRDTMAPATNLTKSNVTNPRSFGSKSDWYFKRAIASIFPPFYGRVVKVIHILQAKPPHRSFSRLSRPSSSGSSHLVCKKRRPL